MEKFLFMPQSVVKIQHQAMVCRAKGKFMQSLRSLDKTRLIHDFCLIERVERLSLTVIYLR